MDENTNKENVTEETAKEDSSFRNRKKIMWIAAAAILLMIAIVCIVIMLKQNKTQENAESQVQSIASEAKKKDWSELSLEEKAKYYKDNYGIDVPVMQLDFADLQANTNKDIYAWIYIPEIDISYPVVQHPSDDAYYLDYNLDGSKGYPGGIYTEPSYNKKDFSDRMTVIYGHNLKSGKAFTHLHDLENEETFNKTRYIFIYMPNDILVYQIFTAYVANDTHLIAGYQWNDQTWVEYLSDRLKPKGKVDHSIPSYSFTKESKVLTLSTCVNSPPDKRYLVMGVLLT